jgi:hypothetical protein
MPPKGGKGKTNRLRAANGQFTSLRTKTLNPNHRVIPSPTLSVSQQGNTPADEANVTNNTNVADDPSDSHNSLASPSIQEADASIPQAQTHRRRRTTSLPAELASLRDEAFPAFTERQLSPTPESSTSAPSQESPGSIPSPNPIFQRQEIGVQSVESQVEKLEELEDHTELYSASPPRRTRPDPRQLLRERQEQERRPQRPGYVYISNSFGRLIPRRVLRNMNATISGARDTSPSPGINITYAKRSWKLDATLIVVLHREIEVRGFPHLARAISEADFREARAIVRGLDPSTKKEFREKAIIAIHSQNSSIGTLDLFNRFLNRFRDGPTPG